MAAASNYRTRLARAVRIYCPVQVETFQALLSGNMAALEDDPVAGSIIGVIRGPNPLGDFGLYKGVFEVSLGFESFMPSAGSKPALGEAGKASVNPTIVVTTFVGHETGEGELSSLLQELLNAHPWEVPVIEIASTELLLR